MVANETRYKNLKIDKFISLSIFEKDEIKNAAEAALNKISTDVENQFFVIKDFINDNFQNLFAAITYDGFMELFKHYFYEETASKAISIAFRKNGNTDIKINIISVMNDTEFLNNCVTGRTMISAYDDHLRNFSSNSTVCSCILGYVMLMLKKRFLNC